MGAVRTVSLSLVVAALVAFAAAPAQAQDAEKARQLFQQGSKYYDLGQFDKAIEAWQQGYDQKPDPGFLYNIAQAYRQKQDAAKAIFFYKGYLRNSPKAHNRAEVEQKIAALQKQAGDTGAQTTSPPPGNTPPPNNTPPPPNNTPPPPNNTLVATSPNDPTVTVVQPPPPVFTDAPPTTVFEATPPPAFTNTRRFDAMVGLGPGFWSSGVNGTAKPSFVLTGMGGYTFGPGTSRFRFRLGGLIGYTFLGANENGSNVTFMSFLIDPRLEIRLTQSGRLYADVGLGLGVQVLFGLEPRSKLLAPSEMLAVNGAQSMVVTRLSAGLGFRVTPDIALFTSLAQMNSPKKAHFYQDIARVEWLFGARFLFGPRSTPSQ
jgi:hypothetical protein